MAAKKTLSPEEKKLMRRYLIWCYKTTQEALDRVDRYFTQRMVDEYVMGLLLKDPKVKDKKGNRAYLKKLDDFAQYMEKKEDRVLPQKYLDIENEILHPEYQYVQNRLGALKKAIVHFFSQKELQRIESLYEEEMTRRILEAREHS